MHYKRQVYVVDDDSDVRTSLFFCLTSLGYDVRSSSSGQAFLDDVDGLKPGCLLLDVRMPGIDGLQLIEALGERIRKLPIVVMTGHGDVALAVRAMKLGASDFIEKPFEENDLIAILESVLSDLDATLGEVDRREDAERRVAMLTAREADVLRALVSGLANKVIAYELGLSVRTVEMHRGSMMQRLGVRTLPDALSLAYLAGLQAVAKTISRLEAFDPNTPGQSVTTPE